MTIRGGGGDARLPRHVAQREVAGAVLQDDVDRRLQETLPRMGGMLGTERRLRRVGSLGYHEQSNVTICNVRLQAVSPPGSAHCRGPNRRQKVRQCETSYSSLRGRRAGRTSRRELEAKAVPRRWRRGVLRSEPL